MDAEQTSYKGKSMQPLLHMCLFGTVRLFADGRQAEPFKTLKARDLLAFLALYPNRVHERAALQTMLWPDVDVNKSQNRLSVTLYLLRQTIEDCGIEPELVLDATRDMLGLRPGVLSTDQDQLVRLSDLAREEPAHAERAYRQIVELYTGPLMGTGAPHWVTTAKVDAEIRFQEAIEWLADRLAPPHEPRAMLHRFLEVDPTSERAGTTLIDWLLRHDMPREAYAYAVQFAYDARKGNRTLGPMLQEAVQRALAYRHPSVSEGVTSVCTVQGVTEQKLDQVCEAFVAYRPGGNSVYVPDPLVADRLAAQLLSEEPTTAVVIKTFIGSPGTEGKSSPKARPGFAIADLPSAALLKTKNESYVVGAVGSGYYSLAFS